MALTGRRADLLDRLRDVVVDRHTRARAGLVGGLRRLAVGRAAALAGRRVDDVVPGVLVRGVLPRDVVLPCRLVRCVPLPCAAVVRRAVRRGAVMRGAVLELPSCDVPSSAVPDDPIAVAPREPAPATKRSLAREARSSASRLGTASSPSS